jgi:hypothetical protein
MSRLAKGEIMKIKTFFKEIFLCMFLFTLLYSISFADPVVIGERIEFSSTHPRLGETITLTVYFRVEGGCVDITINSFATLINPPGSPPSPTIVGDHVSRRYSSGSYGERFNFIIPRSVPGKICFSMSITADNIARGDRPYFAFVDNACLEASPAGKIGTLRVASAGVGHRVTIREPDIGFLCCPGGKIHLNNAGTLNLDFIVVVRFEYQTATDSVWRLVENKNVFGLQSGHSVPLSFRNPPADAVNFRYTADPDNQICESREDNNILELHR